MNSKRKSVFRDTYYRPYNHKILKLSNSAKDDESFVQRLGLLQKLPVHQGCVNTICWNDNGEYILSGSDDQHLVVTNGHTYKVESNYTTNHHANIFSAKFLPNCGDKQIVSCAGDGVILHTDLTKPKESYHNQFTCHAGTTTYEVITIPNDPNLFLSCGEDGTVRLFDLRVKTSCRKQLCKEDILISCQRAVTALAISPTSPNELSLGCADSTVRIFDRRFISTPLGDQSPEPFCCFVAPHFDEDRHYRITSLSYSMDGRDMLVSYSSDYLYLFSVQECNAKELKKPVKKMSPWEKLRAVAGKRERLSPPPVRRLRLRGDWSDTGPDARPERETTTTVSIGQARPQLQATLMQRMTDVLSRMLNDPMTRAALSAGGEDSLDPEEAARRNFLRRDSATEDDVESSQNENEGEIANSSSEQQNSSPNECRSPSSHPGPSTQSGSGQRASTSMSHLHNHLTTLRHLREGFIEQHGSEPSVSFRLSNQSTSNSTISLRADETNRNIDDQDKNTVPSTSEQFQNELDSAGASSEMNSDCDDESDFLSKMSGFQKYQKHYFEAEMKKKYVGHRNARTMIKEATFWGNDYVMSGSDCGHIFIWNKHTTDLKMLLQADQHVVNCLQPHPTLPILATSGIDHDIKLWAPTLRECGFDEKMAEDLINRNAIMLEETRDTITVPAAFMIRMLACLNQIRRGTRVRSRRREDEES